MINEEMKDKKDKDERGRRKKNRQWCKVNKTNRKRNMNDDRAEEEEMMTCCWRVVMQHVSLKKPQTP